MKKLLVLLLLCGTIPAFSNAVSPVTLKNKVSNSKRILPSHSVGHWFDSTSGNTYTVYVFDDNPTVVARVSVNGNTPVSASGSYNPSTQIAQVISSVVNFEAFLTFP